MVVDWSYDLPDIDDGVGWRARAEPDLEASAGAEIPILYMGRFLAMVEAVREFDPWAADLIREIAPTLHTFLMWEAIGEYSPERHDMTMEYAFLWEEMAARCYAERIGWDGVNPAGTPATPKYWADISRQLGDGEEEEGDDHD